MVFILVYVDVVRESGSNLLFVTMYIVRPHRLICNMTNSGHFVTWSELDLMSNFKTDLSGSNYILCFESSHQDKHNGVHIIFLHL